MKINYRFNYYFNNYKNENFILKFNEIQYNIKKLLKISK